MRKRLHIHYCGTVQGIGFRFTAEHIANKLGIIGWVRNLADGGVEILCEGDEKNLIAFTDEINGSLGRYISSRDMIWGKPRDEFEGFHVKF